MSTIKEKLDIERHNVQTIKLWAEGTFYVAYERSAYLFTIHVKQYKVRYRYVKAAQQDVVSIGFNKLVLPTLPYDVTACDDGSMMITVDTHIDEQDYEIWRTKVLNQDTVDATINQEIQRSSAENEVITHIRSLNMADMTPMQCMVLLAELQKKLR